MYYDCEIDQERLESSDKALCDWASMGVTDEALRLSQLASVSSLVDYVAKLLARLADEERCSTDVVFRDEF